MMSLRNVLLALLTTATFAGCSSQQARDVQGSFPNVQPHFDAYYPGQALSKDQSALLITAKAGQRASIYILQIGNMNAPKQSGLIGGSEAAIVQPGQYTMRLQLHDQGVMTIPLTLNNIELKAKNSYLINFYIDYPADFDPAKYGDNDLTITVSITNLDTSQKIYTQNFNGWGKPI
jgi:hypothetical protein